MSVAPSHGWLAARPTLGWVVEGVAISPNTKTRNVEYAWAAEALKALWQEGARTLLDAAAGYVPTWHMMPDIAAALGYSVTALDLQRESLEMPRRQNVLRMLGDAETLPFADGAFDVALSISVLEHLSAESRRRAVAEMCRVARMAVIVTADNAPWLPQEFTEHLSIPDAPWPLQGEQMAPNVYALYARKGAL